MAHEYKIINGTSYHIETPIEVVKVLEYARANDIRIILNYGNTKTGKSWNEEHDIKGYVGRATGYVGRSTGSNKIPLLIYSKRSFGGGSILSHCILSIHYANKKDGGSLYQQQ